MVSTDQSPSLLLTLLPTSSFPWDAFFYGIGGFSFSHRTLAGSFINRLVTSTAWVCVRTSLGLWRKHYIESSAQYEIQLVLLLCPLSLLWDLASNKLPIAFSRERQNCTEDMFLGNVSVASVETTDLVMRVILASLLVGCMNIDEVVNITIRTHQDPFSEIQSFRQGQKMK